MASRANATVARKFPGKIWPNFAMALTAEIALVSVLANFNHSIDIVCLQFRQVSRPSFIIKFSLASDPSRYCAVHIAIHQRIRSQGILFIVSEAPKRYPSRRASTIPLSKALVVVGSAWVAANNARFMHAGIKERNRPQANRLAEASIILVFLPGNQFIGITAIRVFRADITSINHLPMRRIRGRTWSEKSLLRCTDNPAA